MKLLTIDAPPAGRPGALLLDGRVLDLQAAAGSGGAASWMPDSVRGILEAGDDGLDAVKRAVDDVAGRSADEQETMQAAGSIRAFDDTAFAPPVPNPWMVLSVGMNYHRHLAEMSGTPPPAHPSAFLKTRDSLLGNGKAIRVPPQYPDNVDYEGEFCFVFGRMCHDVSEDEAMDHIAGYTIANDVSARDWIPEVFGANGSFGAIHAWERNIMGKNLPGFTPCGPVITTKDEIADPHDLQLTTRLNGEVMQSTKTDDLIFNLPQIVSYFSKWYRFHPGDVVTTGSPAGVGVGRDPKVFMKPGDTIEVELEGVGTLNNTLVAG